jgi:hypothetical protein
MAPSSKSDEWTAEVSLRRDYIFDGQIGDGPERRFPGWLRSRETSEVYFTRTNKRDELQETIARAQMALICPHLEPTLFAKPIAPVVPENKRSDFSPNVVCISITAPELPNLSFYDLPGIIGQSEDQQKQFLVKFVQDLVTDYIMHPDALILLACSLGSDIATSTASGIARKLGAEDRCVGEYANYPR